MKKISKKSLLIIAILSVVSLSAIILYSTYATGDGITPDATFSFNLNDSTITTVEANSSKLVYYQIKNANPGTVRYGVGYSSTSSTVYIYSDSENEASDLINRNDTKIIKLRIENTGNTIDTVEISTIYGYVGGGDLILPEGVTLVTEKICNIKFEPNGGTVNTLSKFVKLNDPYGDLPTPTRTGYTFKGWNGKNMFDENKILMAIENATYENGYYKFSHTKAHDLYGESLKSVPITFEKNKQYTYSVSGSVSSNSNFYIGFRYIKEKELYNNNDYIELNSEEEKTKSLTSNGEFSVYNSLITYGYDGNTFIKYIQLEEGANATPYEPYYVTSNTLVTERNTNYVLTAIWEEDNG